MSGTVVFRGLLPEAARRRNNGEELFHRAVVQYLRLALPHNAEFFHIPNGGQRHSAVAQKLVPLGLKAGIPDLCVLFGGYATFLELKTPSGSLSASQRQMQKKLEHCGCPVYVCRELEDVRAVLLDCGIPLDPKVRLR